MLFVRCAAPRLLRVGRRSSELGSRGSRNIAIALGENGRSAVDRARLRWRSRASAPSSGTSAPRDSGSDGQPPGTPQLQPVEPPASCDGLAAGLLDSPPSTGADALLPGAPAAAC